jgi:hypothetical protein
MQLGTEGDLRGAQPLWSLQPLDVAGDLHDRRDRARDVVRFA